MSQGQETTGRGAPQHERSEPQRAQGDAARKRAAVEMIARHGPSLKRTARRFSLDAEDAEDAYQRALEIVLTKAPTTEPRDLLRWTHTVTKHEALAVRQSRERLLGPPGGGGDGQLEPIALLPAAGDGPEALVERREAVARSREALSTLKPAERQALGLLAGGYSYAEIGELTGFSQTKVNRVLAEGRARFRQVLAGSEDGTRCRELQPLLSAFCDGEAGAADVAAVREHLRACAHCRATARAYRAAPRIVAGLAPLLPPGRSLLGRLRDLLSGAASKLPGGGGDGVAGGVAAAGGSGGAGAAGLAKLLVVCAGAASGTAACVATGVLPAPGALQPDRERAPRIERVAPAAVEPAAEQAAIPEPAPLPEPEPQPEPTTEPEAALAASEPTEAEAGDAAGAIEYQAPPAPSPPPTTGADGSASGSAAGEFGP